MTDPLPLPCISYHDDGVCLSWFNGTMTVVVDWLVDDALGLATAIDEVVAGEIESTRPRSRVQWWPEGGVLVSVPLGPEASKRFAILPMAGASAVADAIRRAVSLRDEIVIHDADIAEATAEDFR